MARLIPYYKGATEMEKMSKYNGLPKDFIWGGALAANQMEEEEAHRFLQRRSMESGMKLTDVARLVLEEHPLE